MAGVDPWSVGAGLIGGLGNIIGQAEQRTYDSALTVYQNQEAQKRAQEAMAWSADQAQKQMDFQERMSNSAYQRATADMKAAGINPMLAISQGGASSPSGAQGSPQVAPVTRPVANDLVGKGVSSALDAIKLVQDVKESNARIAATSANTAKTLVQTAQQKKKGPLYDAAEKAGEMVNDGMSAIKNSSKAINQYLLEKQDQWQQDDQQFNRKKLP